MNNMSLKLEGKTLTITIPDITVRGELSTSKKSLIIATTSGNVSIPGAEHVKLGLNLYTKAD